MDSFGLLSAFKAAKIITGLYYCTPFPMQSNKPISAISPLWLETISCWVHYLRFGARTGSALIILGAPMLVLTIFFSGSIETLFMVFPRPMLGMILFLTGSELSIGHLPQRLR
jgi:hypothetical protein